MADDITRDDLAAMEARLMQRLNDGVERIIAQITDLRSEHAVTRNLVTTLPATVLGAIEQPLLQRISATEARVTKLEPKT
jgi:hypothetical protein